MDRAEAIKVLQSKLHLDCSVNMAIKELEARAVAISALREQEQNKWISVNEKPMPAGNEEYEVCCDYHGEKRIEIHKGWNTHCVTHWRPLPEPPKEGAEG
jgi:hypothetical protein